jgi:hypothetical protein
MSETSPARKRANYGIDAPGVVRTLALVGMAVLGLGPNFLFVIPTHAVTARKPAAVENRKEP